MPLKKGDIWRQTRGRRPREDGDRHGRLTRLQASKHQEAARNPQKLGGGSAQITPQSLGGSRPCLPGSDSWPPDREVNVHCFEFPICGASLQLPQDARGTAKLRTVCSLSLTRQPLLTPPRLELSPGTAALAHQQRAALQASFCL